MNYKKMVLEHLSDYKKRVLNIQKDGYFAKYKTYYSHILPCDEKKANIIDSPYKDAIIENVFKTHTHMYFHHLNSSQAACYNLFFPIIIEGEIDIFLKKLNILNNNSSEVKYYFEYIEDSVEKTNFDAFFTNVRGKCYLEFKYTEQDFGNAKNDKNHREKYENIYLSRLKHLLRNEIDYEYFLKNYQIFRNIIYAGKSSYVVFVIPRKNVNLCRKLTAVLETLDFVDNIVAENIHILHLEDIVELHYRKTELMHYMNKYKEKYII